MKRQNPNQAPKHQNLPISDLRSHTNREDAADSADSDHVTASAVTSVEVPAAVVSGTSQLVARPGLQLDPTLDQQNPSASFFVRTENDNPGAIADVVSLHLSRYLSPKDKNRLTKSCRYFHGLFQPGLIELEKAKQLLESENKRLAKRILGCISLGLISEVELFIAEGHDVNVQNKFGNCAVLMAACNNAMDILKLLIEKGHANVDVQDHFGHSPLQFARKNKNDAMVELIETTIAANRNSANYKV